MTTVSRGRRGKVVAGVVVLVLASTAAVTFVGLRLDAARNSSSAPVGGIARTLPEDSSSSELGRASGCHAGAPITNAALLQAQADAAPTALGAAEFSADLYRWLGTNPTVEQAEELAATIDHLLAADADERVRGMFADAVDQARSGKPADPWWVSTQDGQYYVESSTDLETVVSVSANRVFDDGASQAGTQTFTLVRSEQGWQLRAVSQMRTTADLQALGETFSEGC